MPFEYVDLDQAIAADGLRMVVVSHVPSPWGEAAKGIFHIKGLNWTATRLLYGDEAFQAWAKADSAPIAINGDEEPLTHWLDILHLSERLAPELSLLSDTPDEMITLSREIMDVNGLGWERRLQLVQANKDGIGGFPDRISAYIGAKYGYTPEAGANSGQRVVELLGKLTSKLKQQSSNNSPYYFGDEVSAVDIYSAAIMALFAPLPGDVCDMKLDTRAAFETLDGKTRAALDPILLEHRDHMYEAHLKLPLSL